MTDHRVRDLMTTKLITFFEEQTLPLAGELMKLKKFRHLPVVDEEGRLVGLITHRDILKAQISTLSVISEHSREKIEEGFQIKDIMNKDVWTVSPDAPAREAGQLLADHAFSCLPVVDESRKLVGILTDRDFVKYALEILDSVN
jgi:CBS domain-containing membrane protein